MDYLSKYPLPISDSLNFENSTMTKEQAGQNLNSRIRNEYKRKIENIENLSKTSRALESIMPKVETLIQDDENSTNLTHKLHSDQYLSSSTTGYQCSPLLSLSNMELVPEKIQRNIDTAYKEEGEDLISGIIPELSIAYVVVENVFHYWTIGGKNSRSRTLEVEGKITSVGLVKPPPDFFNSTK